MEKQHADKGYRKFWPMMKEMTWKERIIHIVYYYGKYALLGAFLIYMAVSVLTDAFKVKPEKILSGTAINVHMSVEMEKILTDDIFAAVGGTDTNKQEVTLVPSKVSQTDIAVISSLQTKLLSGDFDYVLMDQTALDMLISMQALPDITLVLSEETLEKWGGKYIYVDTDGERYPVAMDISNTLLADSCTFDGERLFMGFPVNMDTLGVIEPFFEYLMDNGLLKIQ